MRQPNAPMLTNASMGASVTSDPVIMKQEYMISIQAVWTGAPVGDFTIETTCDAGVIDPATGEPSGLSNWSTYTGSLLAAGGAGGDFTWRFTSMPDAWVRLKYTRTSGTGSLSARFNAKGV